MPKTIPILPLYKIVVRNNNGKVVNIHEVYSAHVRNKVEEEMSWIEHHPGSAGNTITITKIRN